ncbi:MAG: DUF192 domain-containing protein [Candidatus Tyrphobacter sp.]
MAHSHSIRATPARSFAQRTLGLIGRTQVGEDEGMLFDRCSSIHTLFMRIPIDVVFLDAGDRVVRAVANVRPWRPFVGCVGASRVVELAAGSIERRGIRAGDLVTPTFPA